MFIENGKIVSSLPQDAPSLDVGGMIVMPGGVDIHSHFASSSCNHARRLLPDERAVDPVPAPDLDDGWTARSGTGGTVPSTFTTGYRYAGLGYTTAFDAAVAPVMARHSHAELDDTPCLDGGIFVLMGNDEYLLRQIAAGERQRARDYAGWLLGAAGGYAIKIVNPGGVEAWKSGQRNLNGIDDPLRNHRVTARSILETLTEAANDLGLPIRFTSIATTWECRATRKYPGKFAGPQGPPAHFTHLQFHSYGGPAWWKSAARHGDGVRQYPSGDQRRRRPGDVRTGYDHHRRWPSRIPAL